MPTPITQNWVFTIPIPFWITRAFHIEEGLLITIQVAISLHRTNEEFNSFTIGVVFRRRTERSLPPSLLEESRITFGYLWPNLYHRIEEDLIVRTPSRGSIVTGVTTSGTTTPVDPPSPPEELHEVPLPPNPLPEIEGLPEITILNQRIANLRRRVVAFNQEIGAGPSNPPPSPPQPQLSLIARERIADLLTRIRSGENLDEPAFGEGTLTYRQLRRIDQQSNPHLYTEASLLEDADYQSPRYQEDPSEEEEVEEGVTQAEEELVEEQPLPIPEPQGIHLRIPRSEHNSPGSSEERLSRVLDEHLGTLIETTFRLPESPESD